MEATARLVEQLAAVAIATDVGVAWLEVDENIDHIVDGVTSITLGDEVVLRHTGTGEAISLNSHAAQVWHQLSSAPFDIDSLDPAEFSPDVRAEYDAVRDALATEAAFALATETEPPGAELTLDGRKVGRTPISVRLHRGRHAGRWPTRCD